MTHGNPRWGECLGDVNLDTMKQSRTLQAWLARVVPVGLLRGTRDARGARV